MKYYFGFFVLVILFPSRSIGQVSFGTYKSFSFEKSVIVPGDSVQVYDALTGDISGWWDHSFKKKPYKLYIEAKPGGAFWEIFNESGDGAKHATVIYAERGKKFRMVGPLGLSGLAIQLVCTYTLIGHAPDSTKLHLEVHGSGEWDDKLPEVVSKVWDHFLFVRFKPYMETKY